MPKHSSPEQLSGPLDVLETCRSLFEVAYFRHLSDREPAKHVQVIGDAEIIRLTNFEEPYDIILGRPHLEAGVDPDIAFWLVRLNTIRAGLRNRPYEYLIARNSDGSQFYIKEKETDTPVPYGEAASKEIIDYFNEAEIQDLGITDFG